MAVPNYLQFAEQAPIARGAGLTGVESGLQTALGTAQSFQQLKRNKQLMQQAPLEQKMKEAQLKQIIGNVGLIPAHQRLLEAQTHLALLKANHPATVYDSQLAKAISDQHKFKQAGDTEAVNKMQPYIDNMSAKQQKQSIDPIELARQKQLIKDMAGSKKVTMDGVNTGRVFLDSLNRLQKATNAIKDPWHRGGSAMYSVGSHVLPNDPDTKLPEGYGRKMARLFDKDWQTSQKESNAVKNTMYKIIHTPGMRSSAIQLGFINKATPSPDMTPGAFNKTVNSWRSVAKQLMEKGKFMQAAINNGVKDPMVIDNAWEQFLENKPITDEDGNVNIANTKAWKGFVPGAEGAIATGQTVRMQLPNGKTARIPSKNVAKAIEMGAKRL